MLPVVCVCVCVCVCVVRGCVYVYLSRIVSFSQSFFRVLSLGFLSLLFFPGFFIRVSSLGEKEREREREREREKREIVPYAF